MCRRGGDAGSVLHTFNASDVLREPPRIPAILAQTGLADLDATVGGIRAGDVWLVLGPPRSGRSMLTLQLAARLASSGTPTRVVLGADSAHEVISRVRACSLDRSLSRCREDTAVDAAEAWTAWPMEFVPASETASPVRDAWRWLPTDRKAAVVLDDLDLIPRDPLRLVATIREWAAVAPRAALVSMPSSVTSPSDPTDWQAWVRLADVVLAIDPIQPGTALLRMLAHRRGAICEMELDELFGRAQFRHAVPEGRTPMSVGGP